jgi:hypothetical protein
MPARVQGSPYSVGTSSFAHDYGYNYPNGINLRPSSPTHEKLKSLIYDKARDSYGVISRRFESWNKIDQTLTAYIRADDAEKKVQDNDDRKPISIVVPYSYATMETLLTYMIAAFIQDPIFRYEGVGPEDTIGSILLELIIAQQSNRFKHGLPLHTAFRDNFAYGFGLIAPYWREIYGFRTRAVQRPKFSLFGMNLGKETVRERVEEVLFAGNDIDNIDPYRCLPDPNYSIHDVQKMEFFGWVDTVSLLDLLADEKHSGDVFNAKYLKELSSRRSTLFKVDDSARNDQTGGRDRFDISETIAKPVDRINMFVKLIPKDYGLPGGEFNRNGEYPEKWFFQLAADQVMLKAQPLGLDHDLYPVCVCAPDYDGRSIAPISRLELVNGLQQVLNFMFNSHVANVRKAINDMIIYDPFVINSDDLRKPGPGKLVRTRRSSWGRGNVKDFIQQLAVVDVTANHMTDARGIMDMMDRASAATHNLMGVMRPGSERRSAAEFEGTQGAALNRLERIAKVTGMQLMQDLGYMCASHTQQFLDQETYVKCTGDYQKKLMAEFGKQPEDAISVDPLQLLINYDTKVRDGSVPGGNFSQSWIQLFQIAASQPTVGQRVDLFRVFKYIARNLGAKDVDQFEIPPIQTQTMPNEQVAREAEKGNIIPFGVAQ